MEIAVGYQMDKTKKRPRIQIAGSMLYQKTNEDFNRQAPDPNSPNLGNVALKIYTCPMHAEVKLYKPGKCPKCEMALVKRK